MIGESSELFKLVIETMQSLSFPYTDLTDLHFFFSFMDYILSPLKICQIKKNIAHIRLFVYMYSSIQMCTVQCGVGATYYCGKNFADIVF